MNPNVLQNLPRSDQLALNAVQGWVMLGNLHEASQEFENVSFEARALPEVLRLQSELHLRKQEWQQALEPTKRLYEANPNPDTLVNLAFCVRYVEGVEQSLALLTEGRKKHGEHWGLLYNLACYHAVLGNPTQAEELIQSAIANAQDPSFVFNAAIHDADLAIIRDSLHMRYSGMEPEI